MHAIVPGKEAATFVTSREIKSMITNKRIVFSHILCPTNLTRESNRALRYAVTLARAYGAKLTVAHWVQGKTELDKATEHRASRIMQEALQDQLLASDYDPLKHEEIILMGDIRASLPMYAASEGVDLVVMRAKVFSPNLIGLVGSTVTAMCRTAPCPILITHAREREWVGKTTNHVDLKRILVAHDFSGDSDQALEYGLSLAQEFEAEVHVLHVVPQFPQPVPPGDVPYVLNPSQLESKPILDRLARGIPPNVSEWCRISFEIKYGTPYSQILTYARDNEIDLICLGAHGLGRAEHSLFGSNVDRVLRQSPCPVLITTPFRAIEPL